jgi:hypothetical protein
MNRPAGTDFRRLPLRLRAASIPRRVATALAAPWRVARFATAYGLSTTEAAELLAHCLRAGARPGEAYAWSRLFTADRTHPLPAAKASRLFAYLGDASDRRTLSDKSAGAELLRGAGASIPRTVALLPRGRRVHPNEVRSWKLLALFVKPRHGSGGRGAWPLDLGGDGSARMDGAQLDIVAVAARLTAAAAHDDILVQERVGSDPELAWLAVNDVAPVLRLTTARWPDSDPFLHSALLLAPVPGERRRDAIRGELRVPVDAADGQLGTGIWLARSEERWDRLPWSDATLAGRSVPHFAVGRAAALRAMAALPGLPMVTWDVIPSSSGPVFLEGNSAANWLLTNLPRLQRMERTPLPALLEAWAAMRAARPG